MPRRSNGALAPSLIIFMTLSSWLFLSPALAQKADTELGSAPLRQLRRDYDPKSSRPLRIAKGHDTTIEKHPWQIAILDAVILSRSGKNEASQFCGGTLIARRWVLTAAHCVDNGTKSSELLILSGTASLISGGKRTTLLPNGFIVNPDWNPQTHENDIALLHLSDDAIGSSIAGWVTSDDDLVQRSVTITGWGATSWLKPPLKTNVLQEVSLPVASRELCNRKVSYDNQVKDTMICIGDYDHGGGDSCRGDSGGPATSVVGTDTKLIGIVSWGAPDRCGLPQMPGLYTRVSRYASWVRDNTATEVRW
jgi:secreted trypsin-like serine protease